MPAISSSPLSSVHIYSSQKMSSQISPLSRAKLSNDIDILRSLLKAQTKSLSHRNAPTTTTPKTAVQALETISINTSSADETQPLTRAYIKAMRAEVLGIDGGANEELGNKLDHLRGKAEGISEALSEVKV
jgi:hypothetical protein